MTLLFVILIILLSVALGFIVLVQNPKGGGLAGNIAGFSTQFMGVKQTTDVLEKGTWVFAGLIAVLCLVSTLFINAKSSTKIDVGTTPTSTQQQQTPAQNGGSPFQNGTAPATPDSTK